VDSGVNRPLKPLMVYWPQLRAKARTLCGLALSDEQAYLMTRLEPAARELGFPSLLAFLREAVTGTRADLDRALIEALTTHETSFFRDPAFWDVLRLRVIPSLLARTERSRPLRFWSAASSSGQEAYSFGMLMADAFPHVSWEGWATDIAEDTLSRAREGIFGVPEIERGVPPAALTRHFDREEGPRWRARAYLRTHLRFEKYNLLDATPPPMTFDLVMCRNVLVYFAPDDRSRVFERLVRALTPAGWLGLGSTELPAGPDTMMARVHDGAGWMERRGDASSSRLKAR
jgi:chemotaxis protein methyltransferase CheR